MDETTASPEHWSGMAAWDALRDHRLALTPRNFELMYVYCADINPALTAKLDTLIADGELLTAATVDRLHRECLGAGVDINAVHDGSQDLRQIARDLIGRAGDDRQAATASGTTLAGIAAKLADKPTLAALHGVTAALTAETSSAGARAQALEQELSTAVARIGELERNLTAAEGHALTDPLTGVANRRRFDAVLKRAAARADPGKPLSLIMIDIDHFKRFNDTHGHIAGDLVLRLVAKLLVAGVRGADVVARYGGEEFAIIMPETTQDNACTVADQIRRKLSGATLTNTRTGANLGTATASFGVAQYQPGEPVTDLTARADAALYRAKASGRNQVQAEG